MLCRHQRRRRWQSQSLLRLKHGISCIGFCMVAHILYLLYPCYLTSLSLSFGQNVDHNTTCYPYIHTTLKNHQLSTKAMSRLDATDILSFIPLVISLVLTALVVIRCCTRCGKRTIVDVQGGGRTKTLPFS